MAQSITRLESEIYVTLEIACRLLSCCLENIFNGLNRIDSKAPFRHSEYFFTSVASRILSSMIRWYQFCGPALSCRLPNFPSLSANEVDVLVVVLKLSGESRLLSGMDMEDFKRGKNSRGKRFTIYVTLHNVHKDVYARLSVCNSKHESNQNPERRQTKLFPQGKLWGEGLV